MTAAAATCEALLEMEGHMLGKRSSLGGEEGTLAHLLTHSVSHCQFMFQTLQQLVRMLLYLGCKGQRAVTFDVKNSMFGLLKPVCIVVNSVYC